MRKKRRLRVVGIEGGEVRRRSIEY